MNNENEKIIDSTSTEFKVEELVKKYGPIVLSTVSCLGGLAIKAYFLKRNSDAYMAHLGMLEQGLEVARAATDI
jgi:hypothetical protein